MRRVRDDSARADRTNTGVSFMKRWMWATAVLAILVGVAVWVGWSSPWLAVEKLRIEVSGEVSAAAGEFPRSDVDAVVVVPQGTPMLRVSTNDIAERVAALPQVKEVSVYREWPDTLVIDIERRVPVATVRGPSGFDLIDIDGMVVMEVTRQPSDLPFIAATGAGLPAALIVAAEIPPWLRDEIEVIEATTRNNVSFVLRDGSIVRWGGAERADLKVTVLESLLPGGWAVYDVSAPEVPTTSDETPAPAQTTPSTPSTPPTPPAPSAPSAPPTGPTEPLP